MQRSWQIPTVRDERYILKRDFNDIECLTAKEHKYRFIYPVCFFLFYRALTKWKRERKRTLAF